MASTVTQLQERIRRIAADPFDAADTEPSLPPVIPETRPSGPPSGFGSGPGAKRPSGAGPKLDPKQQAVHDLLAVLSDGLNRLVTNVSFIEAPVNKALNVALMSAKDLKDPQMAEKAQVKFKRIFGDLFGALSVIRSNLTSLITKVADIRENKRVVDARTAKQLVDEFAAAIPLVREGFKAINPKGHEAAINAELSRQEQFRQQIDQVLNSTGMENPEARRKMEIAARGADFYIENLKNLVDPFYADSVELNVKRALNENLPQAIQAAKAMAKEFGAVERAASLRSLQKRLNTASKRIVLLAYLRHKS